MIRKAYGVVALVSVIQLAALAGLGGFMLVSGKLSGANLDRLAKAWEGPAEEEGTHEAEKAAEAETTTRPAEGRGTRVEPRTASNRLRKILDDEQQLRIRFDRDRREISYQAESVNRQLLTAMARIEELEDKLREYETKENAPAGEIDKRFNENMNFLLAVEPQRGKEWLMKLPRHTAIKYLREMLARNKRRELKKISEQFKSPEESALYADWWREMNDLAANAASTRPAADTGGQE